MDCRLPRIDVDSSDPFSGCKLERKKYGEALEKIVSSYQNGCVLAINGKWGTGKTTFVEMWKAYLEQKEYKTLYFNAWENDFISDPLIGLLGELKAMKGDEQKIKTIVTKAGEIVSKAVPFLVKKVAEKTIGSEATELIVSSAKLFEEEVKEYQNQRKSIEDFRDELKKYVSTISSEKPVIFIVDELDRCNPNYAVKVLERIKHLFDIPNIVFVLSIDKEQLSASVRGYYGSDLIDAKEYLKRFIDVEYKLPEPDVDLFCNYLFEYYDLNKEKFLFEERFKIVVKLLFKATKLTLRQIEKIFNNVNLSLHMFSENKIILSELLFLLTYFRIEKEELYINITRKQYALQELVGQIEESLPRELLVIEDYQNCDNERTYLTDLIAKLLFFYVNQDSKFKPETLTTINNGKEELNFSVNVMNKEALINSNNYCKSQKYNLYCYISLSKITDKIDLLENLVDE